MVEKIKRVEREAMNRKLVSNRFREQFFHSLNRYFPSRSLEVRAGSRTTLTRGRTRRKAASFKGVGGHASSGDVAIVKEGNGHKIVFKSNFRLDGAPDPKIAFGKNGYVKGTIFAKLGKLKGEQSYGVPASYDLSNFNEIWLWCEKFNVPLAVATLK